MINTDEYWSIAKNLRNHYELFYTFWNLGKPEFDEKISTAAVAFSRNSGEYLAFKFNKDFYDTLSHYERAFVTAHECLHVIFNHGKRFKGRHPMVCNVAADLVINQMLITKYGFDKTQLTNETIQQGVWFENTFPEGNVPKNKNFEYYYDLLAEKYSCAESYNSIDEHTFLEDATIDNVLDAIAEQDSLSDKEKGLLKGLLNSGDDSQESKEAGVDKSAVERILKAVYNPKAAWRKIIRDMRNTFRAREFEKDTWTNKARRHSLLNERLILPATREQKNKNKYELAVFMDVSGSCISLVDKFYEIINTIPTDIFDVNAHVFDTEVRKINLQKDKIRAGGGTCFLTIENYIQKNFSRYPYAVLVVTDGHGTNVNPEYPERWRWILSENVTSCIPSNSKIFHMENFK